VTIYSIIFCLFFAIPVCPIYAYCEFPFSSELKFNRVVGMRQTDYRLPCFNVNPGLLIIFICFSSLNC